MERGVRVLEHDLNVAPMPAQAPLTQPRDVLAADADGASGRVDQAHHATSDRRLAGARLANHAEGLPRAHRQLAVLGGAHLRSDDRRVGKERVSTCGSRWSPYPYKKNT